MKAKKSGNGNGAGRPIGVSLSTAPQDRPVGTVITLSDQHRTELSGVNSEVVNLKVQLGELAFAAEDIERRKAELFEKLRESAQRLSKMANDVVASYGIATNDPSAGMWNLNITDGKIERTA